MLLCLLGTRASSSFSIYQGVLGAAEQVSGLIRGGTMKVASKVPDLVYKHDIWDGYTFFWRDEGG